MISDMREIRVMQVHVGMETFYRLGSEKWMRLVSDGWMAVDLDQAQRLEDEYQQELRVSPGARVVL